MSNEYRLKAIKEIASENAGANLPAAPANIDFYGEDVFNAEAMRATPKPCAPTFRKTFARSFSPPSMAAHRLTRASQAKSPTP